MARAIYESSLWPLWRMGYRPFFFFGSVLAVLLIGIWSWWFASSSVPDQFFAPIYWHGHEMIFGFAVAIVAGFLLTASSNWTRTRGVHGRQLMLLVFVWLAARILLLLSQYVDHRGIHLFASLVDLSFLPLLIYALAKPLLQSRQWRNIQFLWLLGILFAGNLVMHLSAYGWITTGYFQGRSMGLHILHILLLVIGGRVIPLFTQNALSQVRVRAHPLLERVIFWFAFLFFVADLSFGPSRMVGVLALLMGILHLCRLLGWESWQTRSQPILWILHLGYFWLFIFGILIFASDTLLLLPRLVSFHALSIGAMGTLIIGMMSRVALGHSGRPLILPSGMVWAYWFITAAAVLRIGIVFWPSHYSDGVRLVGMLWVFSFGIYLWYYSRIFFTPRADGRPG